jgi:hypothetical protein
MNLDNYDQDAFSISYRLLQNMASRLGRLPGRKSIAWISRGVAISYSSPQPGMKTDYTGAMRNLIAELQSGTSACTRWAMPAATLAT